ncbi:hypothetical protein ES288_D03G187500v1 [Gossypium darwinii]|uniref:Uncharacterized protein n=1 Tax=Gossypium darwinii TaxID=34276 RepID=A0A5D2D8K1_GOSDA|nr:hypothetical protein ES288_D03G187500v1 [Gossypium darwinii]
MCETLTSQIVGGNIRIHLLWLVDPQTLPALNLLHLDYQLPSALFEYLSPMSMIIPRKHPTTLFQRKRKAPHNSVSTQGKGFHTRGVHGLGRHPTTLLQRKGRVSSYKVRKYDEILFNCL